jgi:hypothetical protein
MEKVLVGYPYYPMDSTKVISGQHWSLTSHFIPTPNFMSSPSSQAALSPDKTPGQLPKTSTPKWVSLDNLEPLQ